MTVFAGYGDIFTHWLGLRMWDHSLGPNRNVSILCRIEWNKVPKSALVSAHFIKICFMSSRQQKPLKVVTAPLVGHILEAPPPLTASSHTIDFTCGNCGVVLIHADEGQVYGLLIRCTACGTFNTTGS